MSNTADNSKYKMSEEHLNELQEELRDLLENKDKEISEKIKEARSFGDLTENSEYDEALLPEYDSLKEEIHQFISENPKCSSIIQKNKAGRVLYIPR